MNNSLIRTGTRVKPTRNLPQVNDGMGKFNDLKTSLGYHLCRAYSVEYIVFSKVIFYFRSILYLLKIKIFTGAQIFSFVSGDKKSSPGPESKLLKDRIRVVTRGWRCFKGGTK